MKLADAILQGCSDYLNTIKFGSNAIDHGHYYDVMVTDAKIDEHLWSPIFDQITEEFARANASSHTIIISTTSRIGAEISKLVPWKLRSIQLVRLPKAKLWNAKDPDTHRLTAVKFNDGTIQIEAERLSELSGVRQRFSKPVAMGVFVYGDSDLAPDVEDAPLNIPPTRPLCSSDIRFDGGPKNVELQSLLARMHNNLGHP